MPYIYISLGLYTVVTKDEPELTPMNHTLRMQELFDIAPSLPGFAAFAEADQLDITFKTFPFKWQEENGKDFYKGMTFAEMATAMDYSQNASNFFLSESRHRL